MPTTSLPALPAACTMPERVLAVALDIGKDVHVVYARTAAGTEIQPPLKLPTLASGFQTLTGLLDTWLTSGAYDQIRLGHEPTGVYHDAWSAALLARYQDQLTSHVAPVLVYRLIMPNQVQAERARQSHRRRKTDAIDAAAIASLVLEGHGTPVPMLPVAEQQLRLLLSQLRRLAKQQLRVGVDLLRTLDRLWPGALGNQRRYQRAHPDLPPLLHLVDTHPLERVRVRLLLEHAPDPHAVRAMGVDGIQALFRQHGERCGPVTARRIQAVVDQALLPPPSITAALAQQAQQEFALYRAYEQQIADLEAQAVALLPQTAGQVLTTIPGISPMLAARYLAGIGGEVTRFPSAKQIWSYAGYDPIISQSGNGGGMGSISHRGSPFLRVTLYQLGMLASIHLPRGVQTYVRARERGMAEVPATIHVAHQVNQICYALLTTQQPYQERMSAAQAAHWLEQAATLRAATTRRSPTR